MPIAQFQLPDGRVAEFEVPAGMSEQDIQRAVFPQLQQLLKPAAPAKEPESGVLRQIADVPLGVAKGAVSGARMITDIFGAGNVASEALKGVEESVAGLMSAQSRNDSKEIARIMKEAEDKGFLDQVLAGVKAFGVAPIDMLSQAAGTAIPTIAGGIGARVLGAGVAGARAVGAGVGAGMGAGVTKGSIYEAVKEELAKTGMPAEQIEARAQLAQSYGGENLDQILLGTALGGLAATTGIEPALAGIASKNVLTKAAAKSTAGRIGVGAAAEAIPEFAQASQEQLAQNLALQRQGFDVPLTRGIYGAGTLEALAGAGLGAGVSALTGRPEDAKVTPPSPGEPPKLIGYDPSSQEPMYVFPDGSVAIGEEAAFARRYAEQEAKAAPEEPKLLGYSPTAGQEPLYVFSDGSVAVGEEAAFNRRYEPQKLSPEDLAAIAPDLEGVEFQPVEQPPMPLPKEITALDKDAERVVKDIKRVERQRKGESLAGALRNKLNDSELYDIFGTEAPAYFKSGKKSGEGKTIADAIADGDLDAFVPDNLIVYKGDSPETVMDKQMATVEHIKDKLRNKNYLTASAEAELRRLNFDLKSIENSLELEMTDEQIRQEANALAAEIAAEQGLSPVEEVIEEGPVRDTRKLPTEAAAEREELKLTGESNAEIAARLAREEIDREAAERKAIADRERGLFTLTPQVSEAESAPTGDMFGARGLADQAPKRAAAPATETGLFETKVSFQKAPPKLTPPPGFKLKEGRNEQVTLAARELAAGRITKEEYDRYVEYHMPVYKVDKPEAPLDAEGMKKVLRSNQVDKINEPIKDGAIVGLRMDINALKRGKSKGINGSVVTAHPSVSSKGKEPKVNTNTSLGYYGAARIKNVRTEIGAEIESFKVAQNLDDKKPQQVLIGEWVNQDPKEIYSEVQSLLKDPSWTQVSLDPLRHSFFYDRSNMMPVASADEVLQVGRFVLAKNVKYEAREKFLYSVAGKPVGDVTDIAEAQRVEKALKGKNPLQAAKWMADNATNPDYRLISKRVVDRMQKLMDAGIPFKLHIVGVGDKVPRPLLNANGITSSIIDDRNKKLSSVNIWLNNSTVTGRVGTEERTVLHELIHAVTAGATHLGNFKSMSGTEASKLFRRLHDLREVVVKHFNSRVKSIPSDQLTALEKKVYINGANALADVDEVLATGLTDPDMQAYLESIPYKGKTAWNAFVDAIREFLGLPKAKETALSELLAISDLLFESPLVEAGQAVSAAPAAPIPSSEQIELFNARIAGMKPSEALKMLKPTKKAPEEKLTAEGERAKQILETLGSISNPKPKAADETLMKRLQGIFKPPAGLSRESWFRRMVVDKDAPVIEQLQTKYNNAVRDELDVVRPDLNLMQGQDVSNFADLMAQKGGIEIGADGLIHVYENKDASGKPITMDRVLELIAVNLGKKLGSADLAMQLAHNALIANRSNEIIQNNKRVEVRANNMMSAGKSLMKSSDPDRKKMGRQMVSDANAMIKNVIQVRATQEEINAGLEAMRMYPEIQEAYDVFTAYKNNLVDFLQDSGRISKLTAENWKANAGYVPWTRVEEEANRFELDPRSFKNGVVNLSALPQLDKEGSSKEINNIFDNMVGLTYWAVRSGVNNFAAQRTLNTLPDVEVIEEDKVSDLRKKHPDRVVFSYKNGEREAYLLANPFQLATFSTIAPLKGGMFSALFAPAARFLRATITHMPAFAISQLVQDGTYRAALLSGVKQPYKLPAKVFKNFYKALRKQKEGALGELERLGVSGIYDGMPESTANRLRQRNKLEHRSAFKKAWDALEDFSLSADLAVRAAIYEQTMAETGDRALAYYRAKEYINFKRQGTDPIVYELRQSIPFFNAYLQGMDVLYRTMVGKGVSTGERKAAMKIFYMTGMQIAALNLLYTMMMSGDDDYEGLDDYVRNRNYILPGGFKIPVAPEVGFLFKVLPEQLYRTVMSDGVQTPQDTTAVAKRMTGAFVDAFGGMEYLPQLIKPVIELSTNYSFFLESPIVGAGLRNVDPKLQFTESTSELAKMLGGMANISPVKLDYFIRAYTGMAGTLGLEVTDSLMNPDRMGKPLYKTPQISTFMYDPTGRGFKSDFYKFREEVDKVTDTVNMMKREGKAEELADYLTEERATRYALRGMVSKVEDQLSKLRNYRKIIAADTTLSPAERREMTREILDQERELVKAYDIKELRKIAGF